jgi:hypothetical protein
MKRKERGMAMAPDRKWRASNPMQLLDSPSSLASIPWTTPWRESQQWVFFVTVVETGLKCKMKLKRKAKQLNSTFITIKQH